jgi:cytochrome P450
MKAKWNPWERFEQDTEQVRSDVYEDMLQRCPVAHMDVPHLPEGLWTVFSYDDVAKVTADTKTFSNYLGQEGGPKVAPLQLDPPEHAVFRAMLNPFLSIRKMRDFEPSFREMAGTMIDDLNARGTCDLSVDYAYPYPARSLCRLLGAPDADWQFHYEFLMEMDARTQEGLLVSTRAYDELPAGILPYLQNLVTQNRAAPGDNLISHMAAGNLAGEPLDDRMIVGLSLTFMLAGWITTASGMSSLMYRIAADQELQALLREQPQRIPDAIEESLRIDSPVQVMPRRAKCPIDLRGQQIEEGDKLMVSYGAANLDPATWTNPRVFDIDRPNRAHVAFGRGIHHCIGSAMARAELRVSVEELLARTSSIRLAGEIRRRNWPRMAVDNLPVTLVAK